jgi:8-oxo-dGTP pyrophosphatase MutT (NUDIX family)
MKKFESQDFNIIEKDGREGIVPKTLSVVILPFITDEQKLPKMLGILEEPNPFREIGKMLTIVSGVHESSDKDLLSTAIRELEEESGYEVKDIRRWYYLGTINTAKYIDQEQPCFGVDVTDLIQQVPEGDGSDKEKLAKFSMIPVAEAIKSSDCYISFCFLRLFKFFMGIDVQEVSDEFNLDKYKDKIS